MSDDLYSDGGVILRNPSEHGGTWAFVRVLAGEIANESSGVIRPAEIGLASITNNYTELLAAVRALESVADNWQGTLYTDSFVTLCRLTGSLKFKGIPEGLKGRALDQRRRKHLQAASGLPTIHLGSQVVLLGGHPSRADLFRGRRRDGLPVSKWNVRCDQLCGAQARRYLGGMAVPT